MYFHNYLSDPSGQKISTYSQLEQGVASYIIVLTYLGSDFWSRNWFYLSIRMNLIYDHYFTEVDDIDLLLQEVILENYNIHTCYTYVQNES